MPKISVVIPVYNAEKYIDDCIDSVLKQTFEDFELLLIDDGSIDHSLDMCVEWSRKDKRIRVFSQPNMGASAARNHGLDEAKGEWVDFIDSDDKVLNDYLSDLYKAAQKDSNIVMCADGISVYREGQWAENKSFPNNIIDISDVNKLFGDIQMHKYGFSAGKLYRKSIIDLDNLRFDRNVCIAEDLIFMVNFYVTALQIKGSRTAFIDKCNYIYNVHSGSLSTRYSSFEQELYSYQEYKNVVVNKVKRSFIIDDRTLDILSLPLAYYLDRCINAAFQNPQIKEWKKHLSLLNRKDYQKYKKCNNLYESFLKTLFVYRFWNTLYFIRRLIG